MRLVRALALLASLAAPLRADAPIHAFIPAGAGREYETLARDSLSDRGVGTVDLLVFADGMPASGYHHASLGASAKIRAHPHFSVLAKAASHRVRGGVPTVNPLLPSREPRYEHRFTRLAGGLQFKLPWRLTLETWGATDAAGGKAGVLEADLSWWPVIYTHYPVRVDLGVSQDDRTHATAPSLNAELGLARAWGFTWFLTGSGRLYTGGLVPKTEGRAALGVGAGHAKGFGFKAGGGGGAHGAFGELAVFQLFKR